MPNRKAPKKYSQKSIIYITFFILLSIPVIVYGLTQENFDTRNRAFEDLELNDQHQCLISLPNVNPYSLEVGKSVTIQVDARLTNDSIAQLEIYDSSGEVIHQESFEQSPTEIATSFTFTPSVSGMVDLLGMIKKDSGGSIGCEISSPYDIKGLRAIPNNTSPEFTSKPSDSTPSQNIKTGDQYEYTLVASDIDGDRINYSYSFTPRADWLKPVIVEDGVSGKLTIKFRGTTDKPASYLANVLIHDGYSTNLRSQSWVISVSPEDNDIPVITITDPVESLRLNSGESFKTAWEASDINHITGFELYITKNPTDESAWQAINKEIPYNTSTYSVPTSNLESGTYKVIAKAIDNQTPPKYGIGISPEIVISGTTPVKEEENDDVVILQDPQVINMSPSSLEKISNKRVTVKATLIASEQTDIDEESILLTLDGKDISNEMKINKISKNEYTIIYQPTEDLSAGLHKAEVTFSDTNKTEVSKYWTFTIEGEQEEESDTYNIFGYEIGKTVALIVGIGIIVIILAIIAPFVIFSVWKEEKKSTDDTQGNDRLPASTPNDDNKYMEDEEESMVKEKVDKEPEPVEEDVWNMYGVAKPIPKEQQDADLQAIIEEEKTGVTTTDTPTEIVKPRSQTLRPQEEEKDTPKPIIEEPKVDIPEEPAIPEPEIPEPEIPKEEFIQPQIETPEPVVEEPKVDTPVTPVVEETTAPTIPEPEIPDASDLEKIFQEIQKQKAEENNTDTQE